MERLSHDGRGVARVEGKVVFIDGALPGEEVSFRYTRKRGRFDEGEVETIHTASPDRVVPRCPHVRTCGGCSLQHMAPAAQIEGKQQALLEQLEQAIGCVPQQVLPPITGPLWGYRHKARLGVRYVFKKEKLLVGFREKRGNYVADLESCEVLQPAIGKKITALQTLIGGLEGYRDIPQIEVAVGDEAVALVFRHVHPLSDADRLTLIRFAKQNTVDIYLQPGGLESVTPLYPESPRPLFYRLGDHDITIHFRPTDFTQVNPAINQQMVACAIELLQLQSGDRVLDLFCGLGNLTLPIARRVRQITGVEGDAGLVDRAGDNARHNAIENVEYHVANLNDELIDAPWTRGDYNKLLLDPPRSGALAVINQLPFEGVDRMVYISCDPATLARDAGVLVKDKGFTLVKMGMIDMFPHTNHCEAVALFVQAC